DPHIDLESAVAMLADNLRHDAVGVWAAEEHHLHLRAATGYGDITPADISTSGTDTVLAQVLRERRTATAQYGMAEDRPDWAARATLSDVRQYMAALRQTEEAGGLNLPVTVARLADDLRRQSGLAVDFEETGAERPLEPFVERAVIRIIGEGLRNVGQHSGASNANVILRYDDEQVVATIEDDGKGFESNELNTAEERGHYGIVGMRERAEGVGGQLV